jgi:hypothetical protein
MPIRWKYRGETFTADTPEEAAQMRALLKQQDMEAERKLAWKRFSLQHGDPLERIHAMVELDAETPWTPDTFVRFVDRLGAPQQAALAELVRRHHVTDEELRKVVKVADNQALAGVLSGISKQAAALDIPARAIFSFENFRNAGKRRSTYAVSDKFVRIAADMNWPPPSLPKNA